MKELPTNHDRIDTCCIVRTWRRFTFIDLHVAGHSNETSIRTVAPVSAHVNYSY